MTRRILIAYDGTDSARRALERAVTIAGDGDVLGLISVVPLVGTGGRSGGPFPAGDGPAEHRDDLTEGAGLLAEHGRAVSETIEAIGDPATAICDAAAEHGYDMIAIGSRNLRGMKRLLLGSVAEKVVHHAACDVLVAK
jgi:nucleotide-binding universal stress UspA family protein